MQLHTLQREHRLKNPKPRIGRGGKRGTTSGRGQKGQKAHGGRRIPTGLKELIQRLPKLRGVKNKPKSNKPAVVNVGDLAKIQESIITKDLLRKMGFLERKDRSVKILGDGEIKRAITLRGVAVSKSARTKIEKAGGKIS